MTTINEIYVGDIFKDELNNQKRVTDKIFLGRDPDNIRSFNFRTSDGKGYTLYGEENLEERYNLTHKPVPRSGDWICFYKILVPDCQNHHIPQIISAHYTDAPHYEYHQVIRVTDTTILIRKDNHTLRTYNINLEYSVLRAESV